MPRKKLAWPAAIFLITAFIPWLWQVGSVVISPYRLVLIVMVVPCIVLWLMGKAGKIRAADIAIVFYCVWCLVSLATVYDINTAFQSGGIICVETAGAYLMGRCFIRNADQFLAMSRLMFWIVAVIFPFALIEVFTNSNISLTIFSKFFHTPVVALTEPRWGLRRVQSVFEHPILFGVTCGAILALVHMVMGETQSAGRRWIASGLVFVTAALSMSSGPLTALLTQLFLMCWDWFLRNNEMRWRILWALLGAMYVAISMVSNQTVPEFLMTHFTFDAASAYYRVLIWHFGSGSAMNHPLFGVGFGEWDRPDWMPPSIDMFWLYHAVLFGIPAGLAMMAAFLTTVFSVSFAKNLDARLVRYRTAFLIVMTGYFLSGWTVHYWNATYVLFLFLLGSGAWLADVGKDAGPPVRHPSGSDVPPDLQTSEQKPGVRDRRPPQARDRRPNGSRRPLTRQ